MKNILTLLALGVGGYFLNRYLDSKFGAQAANLPGVHADLVTAPPGSDEARGGVWYNGRYYFPGQAGYDVAVSAHSGGFLLNS